MVQHNSIISSLPTWCSHPALNKFSSRTYLLVSTPSNLSITWYYFPSVILLFIVQLWLVMPLGNYNCLKNKTKNILLFHLALYLSVVSTFAIVFAFFLSLSPSPHFAPFLCLSPLPFPSYFKRILGRGCSVITLSQIRRKKGTLAGRIRTMDSTTRAHISPQIHHSLNFYWHLVDL